MGQERVLEIDNNEAKLDSSQEENKAVRANPLVFRVQIVVDIAISLFISFNAKHGAGLILLLWYVSFGASLRFNGKHFLSVFVPDSLNLVCTADKTRSKFSLNVTLVLDLLIELHMNPDTREYCKEPCQAHAKVTKVQVYFLTNQVI